MTKHFLLFSFLLFPFITGISQTPIVKSAIDYVNPFIGTGGHGHTYPGATTPFGMVQLSPDTRLEGWDGCSGYHYSDSIIYGFSHTHLSGTGIADYGDILLMPTQGKIQFDNGYLTGTENGYASLFNKNTALASPGFYQVKLSENDIEVRLTTTPRVGIHEYTFNDSGKSNIIIDLTHRDQLLDHQITLVNNHEIEGFRISKAWAEKQYIYFVLQTSVDFESSALDDNKEKIALRFTTNAGDKILVKVGISAVSIEGARKNLQDEAPHWDFEKYLQQNKKTWTKALNKIEVHSADETKKEIFYTALYHSMLAPNLFSDVDGKYRGMDKKIHHSKDGKVYTVFSLWDTFRATHPLYTIIQQEKTNEFIRTFLKQYQDGGEIPIWELAANYTGCMIGYHAIPVIADAYIKGIRNYDFDLALHAMIHSARQDKLGLKAYKNKGYIASGDESESVSKTLEYAYDDWCIAQMAETMNSDSNEEVSLSKIVDEFIGRSQYYKNLYNDQSGFMQSKMNGGWRAGFDPSEVNFNFTEANSWQYSMFVPQDIQGLIQLHGGNANFEQKLDELFTTNMELSGRHQSDITGLIGQYAHGNEPSHHMAYLYDYVNKPYKTQEKVHQILTEQYSNLPDGLSGNEDCGQMSAWYVLSALGFYAVTPGTNYYAIGTPLFDSTIIHLENGNDFTLIAHHVSDKNKYIQSAVINGKPLVHAAILHQQIMDGSRLVFEMGDTPNSRWGITNMPTTKIDNKYQITPNPYFTSSQQTFEKNMLIGIKVIDPKAEIYFKINDGNFQKYHQPFEIIKSSVVETYAIANNKKSFVVTASFKKIKGGRKIKIISKYDNQYNAGGDQALIDYLRGSSDFRTGYWQGYYGQDVEVIIDLGAATPISKIAIGTLQDIKSWIWFPSSVEIYGANDIDNFSLLTTLSNDFSPEKYGAFTKDFVYQLNEPKSLRYVKIIAKNQGKCPDWHLGRGNDTWIFLDEIEIK